jgi:hypothetical protein
MQDHEIINTVFKAVASCLDDIHAGVWSWKPNPENWAPGGHLVDLQSGMSLYTRIAERGKPAYQVKGEFPKDSRGQLPYVASKGTPSINVSAAKPPARIAEDIARRLIPEWLPIFGQALDAINASNQYKSMVARTVATIIAITGGQAKRDHPHDVSFYRSPLPVFSERTSGAEVHGDDVTLTLVLSHEDAIELLKAMAGK